MNNNISNVQITLNLSKSNQIESKFMQIKPNKSNVIFKIYKLLKLSLPNLGLKKNWNWNLIDLKMVNCNQRGENSPVMCWS